MSGSLFPVVHTYVIACYAEVVQTALEDVDHNRRTRQIEKRILRGSGMDRVDVEDAFVAG